MIVAIAQFAPVHNNLNSSIKKVGDIVAEARSEGVDLVVFGETWLSGYPAWLDHCRDVARWDHEPTKNAYAQLRKNGLAIGSDAYNDLIQIIKKININVIIGVNEIVNSGKGQGTVYNSILSFDRKGSLLNHHRKLMPTFTEKLVHGPGDGHGLKRILLDNEVSAGSLICWEHLMPLARQAMHDEGEMIHAALWPAVVERHLLASRHYAFEGRCFVLAAGQLLQVKDFPEGLEIGEHLSQNPNDYVLNGGSCIINPRGEFIVEPTYNSEQLITAEIDLDLTTREQMTLDVSGHYQRPDVFTLDINKSRK